MSKLSLKKKGPESISDVVDGINAASELIDVTAPLLKTLFEKINEWLNTLGKNNPDSPRNVRLRLAALEAKDKLQKEVNKLNDERYEDLDNRLSKIEKPIVK